MGFIRNFGMDNIESCLGGRFHRYLQELKQFLKRLKKSGATLVFICDGQLQSEKYKEWCNRRNQDFKQSMKILNKNKIIRPPGGCKAIVKSFLKLIEENKYGEIIVSTDVDCDSAIAQYAYRNNAMAIIASDTDYLIYAGSFQFWYSGSLDRRQMRINRFDREKLRALLRLNFDQMKILAAIAGNDYTKHIVMKCRRNCNFIDKAEFCRQLDLSENSYRKIATRIKEREQITDKDIKLIEQAYDMILILNYQYKQIP